jgi:hypothetical protein
VAEKSYSVPSLNLASPGNTDGSFGEALSIAGLIAEADFVPLNNGPGSQFSSHSWLARFNVQKSEKNLAVFERTGGYIS